MSPFPSTASVIPHGTIGSIGSCWCGLPSVFATGYERTGVMARGDGGRMVFEDDEDRKAWLGALGKACAAHGWRVHAWVLVGNHLTELPHPAFQGFSHG